MLSMVETRRTAGKKNSQQTRKSPPENLKLNSQKILLTSQQQNQNVARQKLTKRNIWFHHGQSSAEEGRLYFSLWACWIANGPGRPQVLYEASHSSRERRWLEILLSGISIRSRQKYAQAIVTDGILVFSCWSDWTLLSKANLPCSKSYFCVSINR